MHTRIHIHAGLYVYTSACIYIYIYIYIYTYSTHQPTRCDVAKVRQGDAMYATMVDVKTIAQVRRERDWDMCVVNMCMSAGVDGIYA